MTTQTQHATSIEAQQPQVTVFDLVYAILLVGAGMLAVGALIFGITHHESIQGITWAIMGMIGYLAVWGWGIKIAQS